MFLPLVTVSRRVASLLQIGLNYTSTFNYEEVDLDGGAFGDAIGCLRSGRRVANRDRRVACATQYWRGRR